MITSGATASTFGRAAITRQASSATTRWGIETALANTAPRPANPTRPSHDGRRTAEDGHEHAGQQLAGPRSGVEVHLRIVAVGEGEDSRRHEAHRRHRGEQPPAERQQQQAQDRQHK